MKPIILLLKETHGTTHPSLILVVFDSDHVPSAHAHKIGDQLRSKHILSPEWYGPYLSPKITQLIDNSGHNCMESDGQGILIFSNGLKLAQIGEFADMVNFLEDLRIMLSKEGGIITP